MTDYNIKSNSLKSQKDRAQDDRKIEKIVSGKVDIKKKNGIQRFSQLLTSDDGKNATSYMLSDIIMPAIKKALSDVATSGMDAISDIARNALDIALYGETGHSKKRSKSGHISYRDYYDKDTRDVSHARSRDYGDVTIDNRAEAEDVLDSMKDLIKRYGIARVADLYEMVGVSGDHTDVNYGWTDLHFARIVPCRDGFTIKMPRAMPID